MSDSSDSDSVIIEGPGGRQRRATQADLKPTPKFEMDARARRQQLRHMRRFGVSDEDLDEYLKMEEEQEALEEVQKSGQTKVQSTTKIKGNCASPVRKLSKSLKSTAIGTAGSSSKTIPEVTKSKKGQFSTHSDGSGKYSSPLSVEQSSPWEAPDPESPCGKVVPSMKSSRYASPMEIDSIPSPTPEDSPSISLQSSPRASRDHSPDASQAESPASSPKAFKSHSPEAFQERSPASPKAIQEEDSGSQAEASPDRSPSPETHDLEFWRERGLNIDDKINNFMNYNERGYNPINSPEQNKRARIRFDRTRLQILADAILNRKRHIQACEEVCGTGSAAQSVLFPLLEQLRGDVAVHKYLCDTEGSEEFGRWADRLPDVEEARAYEPGNQWTDFDYKAK